MFSYARSHQPCIIFIDEIDAIGGRRLSEGSSSDREIQRTLMELLSQMDGFDKLGQVKTIMATNRPDTLDPALLRPGNFSNQVTKKGVWIGKSRSDCLMNLQDWIFLRFTPRKLQNLGISTWRRLPKFVMSLMGLI